MEEFEFVLLLLESESLSDCDESFELPLGGVSSGAPLGGVPFLTFLGIVGFSELILLLHSLQKSKVPYLG